MAISVFICHVSDDKDEVARPLALGLRDFGYDVWFDEYSLVIGDDLREGIDRGLSKCDFGVVVVSQAFFGRVWPNRELSALFAREDSSRRLVLPVWHGIDYKEILRRAPTLADRLAVRTDEGMPQVLSRLDRAIKARTGGGPANRRRNNRGERYIVAASIKGSQLEKQIALHLADDLGISPEKISKIKVEVSDDFSCILTFGAETSFIELTRGERIAITDGHVFSAARACVPTIPRVYSVVGLGFPDQRAIYSGNFKFKLSQLSVDVVLCRDPDLAEEADLVDFLHATMDCESCSDGYFWGEGDLGKRLVARFLELQRPDLLCQAIDLYPKRDNRSSLIDVGWCLERQHLDALETSSISVAKALLKRRKELTGPLVERLEKIIGNR